MEVSMAKLAVHVSWFFQDYWRVDLSFNKLSTSFVEITLYCLGFCSFFKEYKKYCKCSEFCFPFESLENRIDNSTKNCHQLSMYLFSICIVSGMMNYPKKFQTVTIRRITRVWNYFFSLQDCHWGCSWCEGRRRLKLMENGLLNLLFASLMKLFN